MFDRKLRNQVPVPLGQELKVVGRVTSDGSRSFEDTGEIVLPNGEIPVSAEGKYLKENLGENYKNTRNTISRGAIILYLCIK